MQTIINWIPGAPDNPEDGSEWWIMEYEDAHIYKSTYRKEQNIFGVGLLAVRHKKIEYHAPHEPPKAERINQSAREMIETEIAERIDARCDAILENKPYESTFQDGALYGLRFALECLDKPAEPMVSIKAIREWMNENWDYDDMKSWLKEQEEK